MNGHKGVQGRGLKRSELPPCRAALGWLKPSTNLASVCKFAGGPEQVNLLKSRHNGGWDRLVCCKVLVGCGPPRVSEGEG